MISDKLLVEEFNFIGVDGLNDEIIIKCIEIATKYKIDEERFVEEWIAFAQTNLNGILKPTTVTLDMMERKQLNKNQEKNIVVKKETKEPSASAIKVYNNNGNSTDVNSILDAYNSVTPKKSRNANNKKDDSIIKTTFSPATHDPNIAKPSTVYAQRKDQGQILETFGSQEYLDKTTKTFPKFPNVKVNFLAKESWDSPANNRYMFESPFIEVNASNDRINYLGYLMRKKYFPTAQSFDENIIYGRIVCDGDRLNQYSVLLETTGSTGKAQVVIVNLSNIPKYALFPGQIIMLEAKTQQNADRKDVLMANKLFCDMSPELPEQIIFPPNAGPLKLIVASGPYTLSDNLAYQPLQDLINYVITNEPDVLILIGPFVDKRHSSVADSTMAETYLSHFQNLMEKVTTSLKNTEIQIIVVSSALDAHHHSVFPTPPFESLPTNKNQDNLHMVSDPAMIDINGIIFGVSSVDVLFHLARTEFNCQPENTDRMARFAEHIIAQRCFYPIYPAQASAPGQRLLPLDIQSLKIHGEFDVKPHVLILPSNLKRFVKNINGCVVINPERLSKGYVGGTFASLNIYPDETQQSLADSITCQIIKI